MPTATLRFHGCLQDSQELGSDNEHLVSCIDVTIEAGGRVYEGVQVNVKQTVGASFDSPLEVSQPRGYGGPPLNYTSFRQAVDSYYRSLVGPEGKVIRLAGTVGNVRMMNNRLQMAATATCDYEESAPGW